MVTRLVRLQLGNQSKLGLGSVREWRGGAPRAAVARAHRKHARGYIVARSHNVSCTSVRTTKDNIKNIEQNGVLYV